MPVAWTFPYTDFGEGRLRSPFPILRAAVLVSGPGSGITFAALIDTGGPVTVVSRVFAQAVGGVHPTGHTMTLRLGGSSFTPELGELRLDLHPPSGVTDDPRPWTGTVAVIDPWPHSSAAVIFGQRDFLEAFTITFGPGAFAIEPRETFAERFGAPSRPSPTGT